MLGRRDYRSQSAPAAPTMFRVIPSAAGRDAAAPYYLAATAPAPSAAVAAATNNSMLSGAAVGGGQENDGSKDESFFEARPWLDSDSDDDFHSVRGDFTPSIGSSTPDHQRRTQFSGRLSVDKPKPPPVVKKLRLIDFLQEKQHYDDEDDDESATDISGGLENSMVHAQEHLKPARKGGKVKKPVKSGCFPNSLWKDGFKMFRNVKTEQKPK